MSRLNGVVDETTGRLVGLLLPYIERNNSTLSYFGRDLEGFSQQRKRFFTSIKLAEETGNPLTF